MLELGGREDAAVEADQGNLDTRAEDEVCELVGQEDLRCVSDGAAKWITVEKISIFAYLPIVH